MERIRTLFFFAGTAAAALSVSGQWEPVLPDTNVWGLTSKGDTLLAGTYDGHLLVSPNLGATWTDRTGNMPHGYIDNIGIATGEKLVCTNGSAIWMSDDWSTWSLSHTMGGSATCMVVSDSTIIAGAEFSGGLSASFDLGETWSLISTGQSNQYSTSVSLSDNTIQWSRFNGPVLRTHDQGANWTPVSELGSSVFALSEAGEFAGNDISIFQHVGGAWVEQMVNVQILDFDRQGDYVVACGAGVDSLQILLSTDNGSTWLPVLTFYTEFQINKVELAGDYLYAGNSDGLYRLKIDNWLAVPEEKDAVSIGLFPNPTDGSLTIPFEHTSGLLSITIMDGLGKVAQVHGNSMMGPRSIDVGMLPPGHYSAVLRYVDRICSGKFVLSR